MTGDLLPVVMACFKASRYIAAAIRSVPIAVYRSHPRGRLEDAAENRNGRAGAAFGLAL